MPICIAPSCDAQQYFSELVIPYYMYLFNGTETRRSGYDVEVAVLRYEYTGFDAVSDVPKTEGGARTSSASMFSLRSWRKAVAVIAGWVILGAL